MGFGTLANNGYATAMGFQTTASGGFSIASGKWVTAGNSNSIVLGQGVSNANRLVNNTASSLMVGFNSDIPTLFVGPSAGAGTSGKVGIGTTNPDQTLHVVNLANDETRLLIASRRPFDGGDAILSFSEDIAGSQGMGLKYDGVWNRIDIGGGVDVTTPIMTITSAGNVGIGTTGPNSTLEVIGNVEIPAANNYTYSTAKTQYQTVSHAAFELAITNTNTAPHRSSGANGPYMVRTTGGTLGAAAYFVAPVELPDGATVTNLDVRLYDTDAVNDCSATLVRQTWAGPGITNMASVGTTGIPGQISLSTATITVPVINKSTYTYAIVFLTTEANQNLGLYNARITYTVTRAD